MDLRPAEVAMRKFPRRFFGVDPEEVNRFLAEAAAALERINAEMARLVLERAGLQKTVKQAREENDRLRSDRVEAQGALARYRGQEHLMAETVLQAQQMKDALLRDSRAEAERTVAAARATAEDTLRSSRSAAAELLRTTRARAQGTVEAAARAASARLGEIQLEADRLRMEAQREAEDMRAAARRHTEQFVQRLEAFVAVGEELARSIESVAARQAEALRVIAETQREAEALVLPAFRGLLDALSEDHPSPAEPALPNAGAQRPERLPEAPPEPAESRSGDGEIVVSPVRSYLEASKLVTAVSRLKGVKSARLRSYAKGSITIDIVTEGEPMAEIDPRLLGPFRPDVIEASARRLILRLPNGGDRLAGKSGVDSSER